MTILTGEARLEERRDQLLGQGLADDPRPEADDVDVVVLHHLMGRVGVVRHRCPDPLELVGSHGGSSARAADEDAPVGAPVEHRLRDRRRVVGVVDWFRRMSAQVVHRVARLGQPCGQVFFQGEAGVIGAECDSHLRRQGSQGGYAYMGLAPHLTTFA